MFELVYSDLWECSPIIDINGAKYCVLFIDAYTRFTWIYMLKTKSEVLSVFTKFKAMIETQFSTKIKALQTDGGGEFCALTFILNTSGIIHCISCPYTPQKNGNVERKNRYVVEVGLYLLAHSHVPHHFWSFAFHTVVYLINRLPTPVFQNKSPYTILYNKMSYYKLLKSFGCTYFPFLGPFNDHKLQFNLIL